LWQIRGIFRFINASRIAGIATAIALVVSLILALYPVQGWSMSGILAVFLRVLLFGAVVILIGALILEFVKAFLQLKESVKTSADWLSKEAPGLLDCKVDGKKALDRLNRELEQLKHYVNRLRKRLATYSERLKDTQALGEYSNPKVEQRKANKIGRELDRNATYLEKRTELFKDLLNEIFRDYEILSYSVNATDTTNLILAFDSFGKAGDALMSFMGGYKESAKLLEKGNLTRTIRVASERLVRCTDNMHECFKTFHVKFKDLHDKLEQN